MSRFIDPVPQYRLDNDKLASSGLMEFYENKNYSTKKDTYADPEETIKNTNPLKLDGQGRMPPCFGTGLYSVKLYAYDNAAIDKKGELQWTRDDVDLSYGSGGAFDEWNPVQTYRLGDIVKDNGQYYVLDNATTSKAEKPSSVPSKWSKTINIKEFTPGRSYPLNETVSKAGKLYQSNEANNTTEPPGAKWNDLSFNNVIAGDLTVSGTIFGDVDSLSQLDENISAPGLTGKYSVFRYKDAISLGIHIEISSSMTTSVTVLSFIPPEYGPTTQIIRCLGVSASGAVSSASVQPGGGITFSRVSGSMITEHFTFSVNYGKSM